MQYILGILLLVLTLWSNHAYFGVLFFLFFLTHKLYIIIPINSTLSLSLSNGLFTIHPHLLYFSYALVFSFLIFSFLINFKFYKKKLQNIIMFRKISLLNTSILSLSIFLGAFWSNQEVNWGGWWSWDSVEIGSLLIFFSSLVVAHLSFFTRNYFLINTHLVFLIFLAVNVLLVKLSVITSVHNFINVTNNYQPLEYITVLFAFIFFYFPRNSLFLCLFTFLYYYLMFQILCKWFLLGFLYKYLYLLICAISSCFLVIFLTINSAKFFHLFFFYAPSYLILWVHQIPYFCGFFKERVPQLFHFTFFISVALVFVLNQYFTISSTTLAALNFWEVWGANLFSKKSYFNFYNIMDLNPTQYFSSSLSLTSATKSVFIFFCYGVPKYNNLQLFTEFIFFKLVIFILLYLIAVLTTYFTKTFIINVLRF